MKFNKDYKLLIKKVAKINKIAAKFLETNALELPNFKQSGHLPACFIWGKTEQGYDYWHKIDKMLVENERKGCKNG